MQEKTKPSTTVRIQRPGYDETYKLDGTRFCSLQITPEGDHILVLEATAADGVASRRPRRRSKTAA